jgi:hypothetical protein
MAGDKMLRMTASRGRDNSQGVIGGGEGSCAGRAMRYVVRRCVDGTKLKQAREPGVQNVSRRRKYQRERDDVVGSAAKRAMSLVYILGDACAANCATVGVVDDGGELSTLNDVALILQLRSIENWKSKNKSEHKKKKRAQAVD